MKKTITVALMLTMFIGVQQAQAHPALHFIRFLLSQGGKKVAKNVGVAIAAQTVVSLAQASDGRYEEGVWYPNKHGFFAYQDNRRLNLGIGCDVIYNGNSYGSWSVNKKGVVTVEIEGQVQSFTSKDILEAKQSKECRK